MAELDHGKYWDEAFSWSDYLEREVRKHRELWEAVWQRARVPEWALEQGKALGGGWKMLIISEDWCGDASNTVPVAARLGEALGWEVKVSRRDENAELMDAYLTGEARSIPIIIVLGPDLEPVGRWGPRPSQLQQFVLTEKAAGLRPVEELYRDVRTWYARDRGESTIREILAIAEQGTHRARAA